MKELNLLSTLGMRGRKADPNDSNARFPFPMGIELELENVHGEILDYTPRGWIMEKDGSLRDNGQEFVFNAPYSGNEALVAIDNFYAADAKYTGGARTSTHVHVSANELTIGAFRTIVVLSYVLEDALFNSIKSYRKWCGYCMPLTEMNPFRLRAMLNTDNTTVFHTKGVRPAQHVEKYYGLNVSSLLKHGTLEYRYFPGGPTKDELLSWADYCVEITKAGMRVEDHTALFDIGNPDDFARFLTYHMPVWGTALLQAAGPEALYEKLNDLICLLTKEPDELVKRTDPLIHVSPQLVGLACRLLGNNKTERDHISKTLKELKVLSRTEWNNSVVLGARRSVLIQREAKMARPQMEAAREWLQVGAAPPPAAPPDNYAQYVRLQQQARQRLAEVEALERRINPFNVMPQQDPIPQAEQEIR